MPQTYSPHSSHMDLTPDSIRGNPYDDHGRDSPDSTADERASVTTENITSNAQPKIVQVAFVHKLYSMLEDPTIQHLISWTQAGDSFVITPSSEFPKVLSTYFKHTNISSFVRQLNMYGFHKASDVFQIEAPDTPKWEFRHGSGEFRKGNIAGLKHIKRRASKHPLGNSQNRDTYAKSPPVSERSASHVPPDYANKIKSLEEQTYHLLQRLTKTETTCDSLLASNQFLMQSLARCSQQNMNLSQLLLALIPPGTEQHIYNEAMNVQADITQDVELLRTLENQAMSHPGSRRPSIFNPSALDNGPSIPAYNLGFDDGRRGSLAAALRAQYDRNPNFNRLDNTSPRRLGSISAQGALSPSRAIGNVLQQNNMGTLPNQNYATPQRPGLSSGPMRRHTSIDLRGGLPWNTGMGESSALPNHSSAQVQDAFTQPERPGNLRSADQQLRDSLERYQIAGSTGSMQTNPADDPGTMRPGRDITSNGSLATGTDIDGMAFSNPRVSFRDVHFPGSDPPTRRSSVAHLLNPTNETNDSDEDDNNDDDLEPNELRKRQRLA